jgi:hypothetical protein
MKKIIFILIACCVHTALWGQHIFVQPFLGEGKIKLYNRADGSGFPSNPAREFNVGHGVNDVVIYKDKMFVSFDDNGVGQVKVYALSMLNGANNTTPTPLRVLNPANGQPCAGMAINPRNGDLYIATFKTNPNPNVDAGVFFYAAASDYGGQPQQFSSFNNDPTVAPICANLAFDYQGNLWMTTWEYSNNSQEQYLICYKGADKSQYLKFTNVPNLVATNLADGSTKQMYAFSQPEGIAFDTHGNLWLGNNNDGGVHVNGFGEGTLLRLDAATIGTLLVSTPRELPLPTTGVQAYWVPGAQFGGLTIHGNTLYANDQTNGHVWKWDITKPFNTTNFVSSNIPSTSPGNGGGCILPMLWMQDDAQDQGQEPNVDATFGVKEPWLSPDIWVRQTDDGEANPHVSQKVRGGKPCWVYVKVRNSAPMPSFGTESLQLYWAKASTMLGWKSPWDVPVVSNPPMGGKIGNPQAVPAINPGQMKILKFPWVAPQPKLYTAPEFANLENEHFCLLARIISSSGADAGMATTELEDSYHYNTLILNTTRNRRIIWRNIAITGTDDTLGPTPGIRRAGIKMANHSKAKMISHLRFALLDAEGKPAEWDLSKLSVFLSKAGKEKLKGSDYDRLAVIDQFEQGFEIQNPKNGLEYIPLAPGESLDVYMDFLPPTGMNAYVVKVSQWATLQDGTEILVGGQAFVHGNVKGFENSVAPRDPKVSSCDHWWQCLAWWVWLLIGLGVLLVLWLIIRILRRKK